MLTRNKLNELLEMAEVSATTLLANGCFSMAEHLDQLVEQVRIELDNSPETV
jgi:hypothetical protein